MEYANKFVHQHLRLYGYIGHRIFLYRRITTHLPYNTSSTYYNIVSFGPNTEVRNAEHTRHTTRHNTEHIQDISTSVPTLLL